MAAVVAGLACLTGLPASPLEVGSAKQLFLDGRFVESSRGVTLVVNHPRPSGEKLIIADRPWESGWVADYLSVIPEGGRINLWYEASEREGKDYHVRLAYAYSMDGGATWTKPDLGIVDFHGSRHNNLVTDNTAGIHVFRNRPDAPVGEKYGLFDDKNTAFVSPDGLHWQPHGKVPFLDPAINPHLTLDSQNVIFWDRRLGKYVAYPRFNFPEQGKDTRISRTFGYATSDTFGEFGKFRIIFKTDDRDPPNCDFYTTAAFEYPYAADAYLMFPAAYHHYPEPPVGRFANDGPLDIQFASSRDGVRWNRLDRRPVISLGTKGAWDGGCMYAGYGLSRQGDELSLYYTAHDITHGAYVKTGVLGGIITRAFYRLDGFVSVDAAYDGGEFVTPPLVFVGDHLELNFDGSAGGWARVEIQDGDGLPISGFAEADADQVLGNSTRAVVTWKAGSDVSNLAGKTIRLRFILRDAKLYAFQFGSGTRAAPSVKP